MTKKEALAQIEELKKFVEADEPTVFIKGALYRFSDNTIESVPRISRMHSRGETGFYDSELSDGKIECHWDNAELLIGQWVDVHPEEMSPPPVTGLLIVETKCGINHRADTVDNWIWGYPSHLVGRIQRYCILEAQ